MLAGSWVRSGTNRAVRAAGSAGGSFTHRTPRLAHPWALTQTPMDMGMESREWRSGPSSNAHAWIVSLFYLSHKSSLTRYSQGHSTKSLISGSERPHTGWAMCCPQAETCTGILLISSTSEQKSLDCIALWCFRETCDRWDIVIFNLKITHIFNIVLSMTMDYNVLRKLFSVLYSSEISFPKLE